MSQLLDELESATRRYEQCAESSTIHIRNLYFGLDRLKRHEVFLLQHEPGCLRGAGGGTCCTNPLEMEGWPATLRGKDVVVRIPWCRQSRTIPSNPKDIALALGGDLGLIVHNERQAYAYAHQENDARANAAMLLVKPFMHSQNSSYYFQNEIDAALGGVDSAWMESLAQVPTQRHHGCPPEDRVERIASNPETDGVVLLPSMAEASGVYVFWDGEVALYVGKGKGVLSRCASTSHHRARLRRLASRITLHLCSTEGDALVLERDLIRRLHPTGNKTNAG